MFSSTMLVRSGSTVKSKAKRQSRALEWMGAAHSAVSDQPKIDGVTTAAVTGKLGVLNRLWSFAAPLRSIPIRFSPPFKNAVRDSAAGVRSISGLASPHFKSIAHTRAAAAGACTLAFGLLALALAFHTNGTRSVPPEPVATEPQLLAGPTLARREDATNAALAATPQASIERDIATLPEATGPEPSSSAPSGHAPAAVAPTDNDPASPLPATPQPTHFAIATAPPLSRPELPAAVPIENTSHPSTEARSQAPSDVLAPLPPVTEQQARTAASSEHSLGSDRDAVATALADGRALFLKGEIAGARRQFARAARLGSAEGALALGITYDPYSLAKSGKASEGNATIARKWYRRAHELAPTRKTARN